MRCYIMILMVWFIICNDPCIGIMNIKHSIIHLVRIASCFKILKSLTDRRIKVLKVNKVDQPFFPKTIILFPNIRPKGTNHVDQSARPNGPNRPGRSLKWEFTSILAPLCPYWPPLTLFWPLWPFFFGPVWEKTVDP